MRLGIWTIRNNNENKQVSVSDGSGTIGQYWYDGDGKLVKKIGIAPGSSDPELTIFVYDAAGKQIAEYSTVVADSDQAKVNYLTTDHLGSPRINTDANGSVVARHDYHPFGEEIATSGRTTALAYSADTIRKQFTGYERDRETDFDFAQGRSYGSMIGRYVSEDPLSILLEYQADTDKHRAAARLLSYTSEPSTWNRYVYVRNNPTKLADPSGEDALVVAFTDYRIQTGSGRVPKLGHAGIILIDEDGTATYYDYGRYDEPENKGIVRSPISLGKLSFTSDGVATSESVQSMLATLSQKVTAHGYEGAIEGAYFNTNQEATDAMKQYAEGRRKDNDNPSREEYGVFERNCTTFTRDVLGAGGVNITTATTPGPTLDRFGTAKAGGLEPGTVGPSAIPTIDIGLLQRSTYTVAGEGNRPRPVGRIPYRPNK